MELLVGFRDQDITDPNREIRVARVMENGTLAEVPSQESDQRGQGDLISCQVAFLAALAIGLQSSNASCSRCGFSDSTLMCLDDIAPKA